MFDYRTVVSKILKMLRQLYDKVREWKPRRLLNKTKIFSFLHESSFYLTGMSRHCQTKFNDWSAVLRHCALPMLKSDIRESLTFLWREYLSYYSIISSPLCSVRVCLETSGVEAHSWFSGRSLRAQNKDELNNRFRELRFHPFFTSFAYPRAQQRVPHNRNFLIVGPQSRWRSK